MGQDIQRMHASCFQPTNDLTSRLLEDCDLARHAEKAPTPADQTVRSLTHLLATVRDKAVPGPVGHHDSILSENQKCVAQLLEERFMASAPKLYRERLGLPEKATSREFVNRYIDAQVQEFQKQPDDVKRFALSLAGLDSHAAYNILANKPGTSEHLAHVMLEKEQEFLQLPPGQLKTEHDFKKIETGIIHNDYVAFRDTERLLRLMQADRNSL